jgi:IS605 OrfB family transposase
MNRIYQGRVTKVEAVDRQGDATGELPMEVLWQHHELYQDAVNYYTLCLASMAEGAEAESARSAGQKRPRVTAMRNWREEVRKHWKFASKKSRVFDGPHMRLAKHLRGATQKMEFEEVEKLVLKNRASPELRLAALLNLLDIAGVAGADVDLTPKARSIVPPLFQNILKSGDAVAASQQFSASQAYVRRISEATDAQLVDVAREIKLDCFLKTPPEAGQAYSGEKAIARLRNCFDAALKKFPELGEFRANFEQQLNQLLASDPEALRMPKGNKPPSLFHAVAVFKYLPRPETREIALKASVGLLKRKFDAQATSDPLFDVRIGGIPPFDYFTNLALVSSGKQKAQGNWFEFDLMAFVEALKSPHRYYQDTQKRETEAEKLRAEIRLMEARGKLPEKEDEEQIYGFEEDERFELIKRLVSSEELRVEAEAEGDVDPDGAIEYGITERTLRGFDEVRRKWIALVDHGRATEERLREVVAEIQADHPLDFGSATLFLELTKPKYHPIWHSAGNKEWHAPSALRAWMDFKELHRQLKDKKRPIRFTPAHSVESPRYFSFPKASETEEKKPSRRKVKRGLVSRHLPGEPAFYAGIVLQTPNGLEPTPVKITFAAPRLLRDELRTTDADENLYAARWLQPMMKALPFHAELDRQNFANCRITLQPDLRNRQNVQLSFPVAIQSATLAAKLEKAARWNKQFYGYGKGRDFTPMALRWPHETKSGKDAPAWPAFEQFSVITVDLGQRTAGALARLVVSANESPNGSRFLGETNGRKWRARLAEHELLRLSGENKKEWRDGEWREELYGSKGRMSRDEEIGDARALLKDFGCAETEVLPADWQEELSFPEINDGLLRAAKRSLGRYGRLHRWRWFLGLDDSKRKTAREEMQESNEVLVEDQLDDELGNIRGQLPQAFCALADRILPLRGRRWHWKQHPDRPDCHLLTQVEDASTSHVWLRGQRGLSFARLEQLEELRKRFQSLNQLMRRLPGRPPNKRRDESVPDPCPDILDKLDRTKEQRVNQTAHMILAEALGLALEPPPPNKADEKRARDLHGVYRQVREPVDFIVIENLSRYRTSQGRAPRENNRLMKWSHRAIRDKLKELCEPFGIPVLETPAAYSSRFCSRSGVAGFRAVEVTNRAIQRPRWKRLREKIESNQQLSTEERHAAQFLDMFKRVGLRNDRALLAPQAGGPIFVPFTNRVANPEISPVVAQADINAAINLGLRAIADPRTLRIHSRLRTNKRRIEDQDGKQTVSFVVNEKRMLGENSKAEVRLIDADPKSEKSDSRLPNFFCDVSGAIPWGRAEVVGNDIPAVGNLVSGQALWSTVKERQWPRILEINQERVDRFAATDDPDEIPM